MTTEEEPAKIPVSEGNYDHVWKVVLLGDSRVGKSSILHRFTQNEFKEDMRSGILSDDLSTKVMDVEGKTVKVKFWDSYGQRRFKPLNRAFCRGCVGAMLIYDITNSTSFEHLETWLDELQEQDADTVIMLLGNKCDLNESREVPAKMAEKFAEDNHLLFMESSALDAMYVTAAFQYLCREIYKFESLKELKNKSVEDLNLSSLKQEQTITTDLNGQPTSAGPGNVSKSLCCTYV